MAKAWKLLEENKDRMNVSDTNDSEDVEITLSVEDIYVQYYFPLCGDEKKKHVTRNLHGIRQGGVISLQNLETHNREQWQKFGSCFKRISIDEIG